MNARKHRSHIPPVITRRWFSLLKIRILLLVHYHQPQIPKRQEDSAARPQQYQRLLSLSQRFRNLFPRCWAERAVVEQHRSVQLRAELFLHNGCQFSFTKKDQSTEPMFDTSI